jgi:hypothetical protein
MRSRLLESFTDFALFSSRSSNARLIRTQLSAVGNFCRGGFSKQAFVRAEKDTK